MMSEMQACMSSLAGGNPVNLSEGLAQLKGEHPPLIQMLNGLFELCQQIDGGIDREQSFELLKEKVAAFIAELDPHSEREEGVLFPMMGKYIGTTSGPIAVMEYEHDRAKTLIGTFLEKANGGTELLDGQKKELAGLIKDAYHTLVDHFNKEENVLFPMAERMLTNEEKQELITRIQAI